SGGVKTICGVTYLLRPTDAEQTESAHRCHQRVEPGEYIHRGKNEGTRYTPFFRPLCLDGAGTGPKRLFCCKRGTLMLEFSRLQSLHLARARLRAPGFQRLAAAANLSASQTLSCQSVLRILPFRPSASNR